MRRTVIFAACLVGAVLSAAEAMADRRLAVGTAAGFPIPPGYTVVPVYTPASGRAWTAADTSLGYTFREPIYATPKGYRYVYVRGYTLRRAASGPAIVKRVSVKPAAKRTRGRCVTDIGYGRHELCS
jgi:hypothetical protein